MEFESSSWFALKWREIKVACDRRTPKKGWDDRFNGRFKAMKNKTRICFDDITLSTKILSMSSFPFLLLRKNGVSYGSRRIVLPDRRYQINGIGGRRLD